MIDFKGKKLFILDCFKFPLYEIHNNFIHFNFYYIISVDVFFILLINFIKYNKLKGKKKRNKQEIL